MGKLILCFSGADGSGKSTLARLTARYFREKGLESASRGSGGLIP